MNYLAHLYFSDSSPTAWTGSLLGDFIKGGSFRGLPDDLVRQLKLHRHMDSYTCRSPAFQQSCRRLNPSFRYARGVLVDVFYDHFLACHWEHYHRLPLTEFAQQVYAGLQSCHHHLTPEFRRQLPRMIEMDWLTSYRQPAVIKKVLGCLEKRIKAKFPLSQGFEDLSRRRAELETDFSAFMLEAESVVRDWKQQH